MTLYYHFGMRGYPFMILRKIILTILLLTEIWSHTGWVFKSYEI